MLQVIENMQQFHESLSWREKCMSVVLGRARQRWPQKWGRRRLDATARIGKCINKQEIAMLPKVLATGLVIGSLMAGSAAAAPVVTLTQISTAFNNPIGIDYYEPGKSVVISANYFSGLPHNLEIIALDGSHSQYSALFGQTDELKIASVRSGYTTGFLVGTIFTGNGSDGQIVKVDPGGAPLANPWVTLPGTGHGLVRGSLYVDRTGEHGGDLIAVTTGGELWRITSVGVSTKIDDVNVHLEGLSVVPNDVSRWGPYAGCIVAGAEGQGLTHFWCKNLAGVYTHSAINLGVAVEDIDVIDGGNFFGVNFGTSKLLGAGASQFAGMVGDILLTQEFGSGSGLYHLRYNGTNLVTEQFLLGAGSATPGQWEHVTFAPAGIKEIAPVPLPGTLWLVGLGLILLGRTKLIRARTPA